MFVELNEGVVQSVSNDVTMSSEQQDRWCPDGSVGCVCGDMEAAAEQLPVPEGVAIGQHPDARLEAAAEQLPVPEGVAAGQHPDARLGAAAEQLPVPGGVAGGQHPEAQLGGVLKYWIMSLQIACGTIRGVCQEAMRTGGVGQLPVRGSAVIGKAMQIMIIGDSGLE